MKDIRFWYGRLYFTMPLAMIVKYFPGVKVEQEELIVIIDTISLETDIYYNGERIEQFDNAESRLVWTSRDYTKEEKLEFVVELLIEKLKEVIRDEKVPA